MNRKDTINLSPHILHKRPEDSRRQSRKYIVDTESKQVGQQVTERSATQRVNNTNIVTLKLDELKAVPFPAGFKPKTRLLTASSGEHNPRRKYSHKEALLTNTRLTLPISMGLQLPLSSSSPMGSLPSNKPVPLAFSQTSCESMPFCEIEQRLAINSQGTFSPLNIVGKITSVKTLAIENFRQKKLRVYTNIQFKKSRVAADSFHIKACPSEQTGHSILQYLRRPMCRKDHFVFGLACKPENSENKMELWRDMLWKINFSNGLYVCTPQNNEGSYKLFVGPGNNSSMVKGLFKRRPWWNLVDTAQTAHLVWTQLKLNSVFTEQSESKQFSQKQKNKQSLSTNISPQAAPRKKAALKVAFYLRDQAKIFNSHDLQLWDEHWRRHAKWEQKLMDQTYYKRLGLVSRKRLRKISNPQRTKMHNHLPENYYIGNKKALFYNLKRFYDLQGKNVFTIIPQTFHISGGVEDPHYADFLAHFRSLEERKRTDKDFRNMWILKPGENTNRGNGISVCSALEQIRSRLRGRQINNDGHQRTFILQKYIEKPLLYKGRKFDIRHYVLCTCTNGAFKAYWYEEGYVRTASSLFSLKTGKDLFIHLTNDAIQKHGEEYGKYEAGNKLSYEDMQRYIAKLSSKGSCTVSFFGEILPEMRRIATEAVRATYSQLDPKRKEHNFEILGLDFMVDDEYRSCLIEVNTNPCLQLSCSLLSRIIPDMLENAFKLCVDPLFPPPQQLQTKKAFLNSDNPLAQNRFSLIFDQAVDGPAIETIYSSAQISDPSMGVIEEDGEVFDNDGEEEWNEREGS